MPGRLFARILTLAYCILVLPASGVRAVDTNNPYLNWSVLGSPFKVQGCKGIVPQFIAACFQTVATWQLWVMCGEWWEKALYSQLTTIFLSLRTRSRSTVTIFINHPMGEVICFSGFLITPCKLWGWYCLTLVCDSARPASLFWSNWPLRWPEVALNRERLRFTFALLL